MTSGKLQGVRVAILVSDGFREFELLDTRKILERAGAAPFVVAPTKEKVKGLNLAGGWAEVPVDIPLQSAMPQDFHALFLPGGSASAKQLAANAEAIEFVKTFMTQKPIAAIGEATEILIQTGSLRGRTITSEVSLERDVRSAGANYVDKNVVSDHNLITARNPEDLSAFEREFTEQLAQLRVHSTEMRKTA